MLEYTVIALTLSDIALLALTLYWRAVQPPVDARIADIARRARNARGCSLLKPQA